MFCYEPDALLASCIASALESIARELFHTCELKTWFCKRTDYSLQSNKWTTASSRIGKKCSLKCGTKWNSASSFCNLSMSGGKRGQQTAKKAQFAKVNPPLHPPPLHTMQNELCVNRKHFFIMFLFPQLTIMVNLPTNHPNCILLRDLALGFWKKKLRIKEWSVLVIFQQPPRPSFYLTCYQVFENLDYRLENQLLDSFETHGYKP